MIEITKSNICQVEKRYSKNKNKTLIKLQIERNITQFKGHNGYFSNVAFVDFLDKAFFSVLVN